MSRNLFGAKLLEKAIELEIPQPPFRVMIGDKLERWPLPFEGCTEAEIEELKRDQKVARLPDIYVQFLRVMGRKAGSPWRGEDITLPGGLKEVMYETMQDDQATLQLSDDVFVFHGHQGCSFTFFFTENEDDDPPVYIVGEDVPESFHQLYKFCDHLSEFLTGFIVQRESVEACDEFLNKYAR